MNAPVNAFIFHHVSDKTESENSFLSIRSSLFHSLWSSVEIFDIDPVHIAISNDVKQLESNFVVNQIPLHFFPFRIDMRCTKTCQ